MFTATHGILARTNIRRRIDTNAIFFTSDGIQIVHVKRLNNFSSDLRWHHG
jgi:hypothetical protein